MMPSWFFEERLAMKFLDDEGNLHDEWPSYLHELVDAKIWVPAGPEGQHIEERTLTYRDSGSVCECKHVSSPICAL